MKPNPIFNADDDNIFFFIVLCFIANYLGHIAKAVEQIARHLK